MSRNPTDALRLVAALAALLSLATPALAGGADKSAILVIDASTGKTLAARNADALRYPASLTKMMTLYVLFEELQARRLALDSRLTVSANAAAQPPSKLGLRPGATIRVEDAILSLTTRSANDMAVTVAENVAGSVPAFAARMNRAARQIGMSSTTYRNPNGLPDPGQTTTARDLAKLGRALQDRFPAYYRYFGVKSFVYAGRRIGNHNRLLGSVQGVDGIKTGYTRASGFNLVTSVNRDGRHLIAVVMGGRTAASRDGQMRQLIATFLPAAKRGAQAAPVYVADAAEPTAAEYAAQAAAGVADDNSEDGEVAEATSAATALPLPRARPNVEQDVAATATAADDLAYASPSRPQKPRTSTGATAAAALAKSKPLPRAARQMIAQGDTSDFDDTAVDLIAQRISTASQVAELAFAELPASGDDPIARLTAVARTRAGEERQTASASPPRDVEAAGWHIQIGAYPTAQGAAAQLAKAKASLGPGFGAARPVTQQVARGGGAIYRARFAGFSDKDQARAACAKLQRRSINCLAVAN